MSFQDKILLIPRAISAIFAIGHMTALREQCADWSARILGETSAVSAPCFGSSDLQTADSTMSLKL